MLVLSALGDAKLLALVALQTEDRTKTILYCTVSKDMQALTMSRLPPRSAKPSRISSTLAKSPSFQNLERNAGKYCILQELILFLYVRKQLSGQSALLGECEGTSLKPLVPPRGSRSTTRSRYSPTVERVRSEAYRPAIGHSTVRDHDSTSDSGELYGKPAWLPVA